MDDMDLQIAQHFIASKSVGMAVHRAIIESNVRKSVEHLEGGGRIIRVVADAHVESTEDDVC
jgi:hypothetical protein